MIMIFSGKQIIQDFLLFLDPGLTKPGEVGEILTLFQLKLPSLDSKVKLKLPCFFLQVAPFLQTIFILW